LDEAASKSWPPRPLSREPDEPDEPLRGVMRSARAAALDKVAVGESRAVEHVADDESGLLDGEAEWLRVGCDKNAAGSEDLDDEDVALAHAAHRVNTTTARLVPATQTLSPASEAARAAASPQQRVRKTRAAHVALEPLTKRLHVRERSARRAPRA